MITLIVLGTAITVAVVLFAAMLARNPSHRENRFAASGEFGVVPMDRRWRRNQRLRCKYQRRRRLRRWRWGRRRRLSDSPLKAAAAFIDGSGTSQLELQPQVRTRFRHASGQGVFCGHHSANAPVFSAVITYLGFPRQNTRFQVCFWRGELEDHDASG